MTSRVPDILNFGQFRLLFPQTGHPFQTLRRYYELMILLNPGPMFDLGPIDQLGFAVRNLEASLPAYQALFGQFSTVDARLTDGVSYRGHPADVTLKIAYKKLAGLEIELVEVIQGEFPQSEHLRKHGEGLQHIRFTVEDVAAKRELLERNGYTTLVIGDLSETQFSYLQGPPALGYSVVELFQSRTHNAA